jgi:hypothetical protein
LLQLQKYKGGYRTIRSINRLGLELEERVVDFDRETGIIRLGVSRSRMEENALSDGLFKELQRANEPLTEAYWFRLVEGRTQGKHHARAQLEADGLIGHSGTGKRNDAKRYFVVEPPPCRAGSEPGSESEGEERTRL